MTSLLLRGARIVDPAGGRDETADMRIEDGRIVEVGASLSAHRAEVLDLMGAVLAPGFIDLHVHLREPGREDEETIASGSAAAALGGFNAVCAMPNTEPVCDNATVAQRIAAEGLAVGLVKVVPAGAITKGQEGRELASIGEMARSDAGVSMFTDDGRGVQDAGLLRRAMEYIRGFDGICAEHCEVSSLSTGGQMNEGEFSELLGLKGIPALAEEVALARDLALARLTRVRFHAQHVSTAGSVDLIRSAKAEGVLVTAEATPHHAVLTDGELTEYDTNMKVNPPLRSAADVEAVRRGLADGTIDAIATDHAPHSEEEKEAEFEDAPPGMLGLQTALAVTLTHLVGEGSITLMQAIESLSTRPARILGLGGFGGPLEPGSPANLVVFDPEASWVVDATEFASLSKNSPWISRTLKGRVIHTVFEGRLVVHDGVLLSGVRV